MAVEPLSAWFNVAGQVRTRCSLHVFVCRVPHQGKHVSAGVQSIRLYRCVCEHALCPCACRFDPAADRYFLAAQYSLDDNLMKLNAAQYMMNSVLCILCTAVREDANALCDALFTRPGSLGLQDVAASYQRIQECAELDFKFITSKERLFLLVGCIARVLHAR